MTKDECRAMIDIETMNLRQAAKTLNFSYVTATSTPLDAKVTREVYESLQGDEAWMTQGLDLETAGIDPPGSNPLHDACERLATKELREKLAAHAKSVLGHQPRNRKERRKLDALNRRRR